MAQILSFGDCNTLGVGEFKKNSYPERFAQKIDKSIKNCGFTMSTTREMIYFFNEFKSDDTEIILIQYGLVDSWKTFKYAPYVLYYPDNKLRKIYRKIVKKYKKVTKKLGLYERFGSENTVPIDEYMKNIEYVISSSRNCRIYLIDTVPSRESFRNEEICRYNKVLDEIVKKYDNVFRIKIYDHFLQHLEDYYLDHIHINNLGYDYIANVMYDNCCKY